MSLDWLASLISLAFSLQLLLEGNLEEFEEVVKTYPCAFPIWLGPFQAFFYICDPDYAKTFLSRTGKTGMNLRNLILLRVICTSHKQDSKGILQQ